MSEKRNESFSLRAICSFAQWKKYPGTCLFILIIFLLYIYISLKIFCPELRQQAISQFHLTSLSFGEWAIHQPVPSMYNFANEVWIGNRPKNFIQGIPAPETFIHHYTWINHYPLRVITFSWYRAMALKDKDYKYISLRSSYRNTFVETCYYLNIKDGRIYMERVY